MGILFRDDRADWKKILLYMYESQMQATEYIDGRAVQIIGKSRKDRIIEKLDIEEHLFRNQIRFLEGSDLIKINYSDNGEMLNFGLTQEGLELAHQLKTERQRRQTNLLLLALTAILTLLTILLFLEAANLLWF